MKAVFLAVVLCLCAVPALAQVPPATNPSGVEFGPSADHDAVANGQPVLTKYTLDIATQAAPTVVVKSVDLGKPAIVNGTIAYTGLAAAYATLPAGTYVAVIKAEGPGGVSAGVTSDPFLVKPRAPAAPGKPVWK